jgi:hypothetical protein
MKQKPRTAPLMLMMISILILRMLKRRQAAMHATKVTPSQRETCPFADSLRLKMLKTRFLF